LDSPTAVDFSGAYPCLVIAAEAEKGFRDRRSPMTPDFAEFSARTPIAERTGLVFEVAKCMPRVDAVSKIISRIGRPAGVLVNRDLEKLASAHDLRRAFGTRWASRGITASVTSYHLWA
jgi:hypothetical protein